MSNSKLVSYTKISPNSSARTGKISKITIHHMAGNLSVEACANEFQGSRQASSNYGIGSDGRIGLYVDESRRAWTSSNRENDNVAVTIEVANDSREPDWHVSDKALEALIDLCVDICRRNGISALNFTGDKSGNLTMHKYFAYTACPGPYLESKFGYIAEQVNKQLGASSKPESKPEGKPDSGTVANPTIYRVQVGAFSKKANAERKRKAIEAAGFQAYLACVDSILWRVQVGAFTDKANAANLLTKLSKAGFFGFITTLSGKTNETDISKSLEQIAKEVVWGKWGNGAERIKRLTEAGYDYVAVQESVNKLMGK